MAKPFFLPLKAKWFSAFEQGLKTIEYRKAGGRFDGILPGRSVTLPNGYSGRRLSSVCIKIELLPIEECPVECLEIYPPGVTLRAIHLQVALSEQTCMNMF